MKKSLSILWFLYSVLIFSQPIESFKLQKFEIAKLSDSLEESSGLDFFNNQLFSFNDSGNTADLFEIDPNNGKIKKVYPTGLVNKDWEALANDGSFFYIGDFGNNEGARKDLCIYKVPFSMGNIVKDSIQKIPFYYPEQIDFTPKNIANDFDAEAMIYYQNKINIFTKEWVSKKVTRYTIDPNLQEPILPLIHHVALLHS